MKVSDVTANIFTVLGVAPSRGRGFHTTEEQGPARVRWRSSAPSSGASHFGGADDVLGRTVRLNGVEHAIVGVLPATFSYPEPGMAVWLPLDLRPRGESDRGDHYLSVVGRLKQV